MTEHDDTRPQGAVPGQPGTPETGAAGTGPHDPTTVYAQSSGAAQPGAAQPGQPAPGYAAPPPPDAPAKSRFRERVWGWKALTASALAGLIIGGGTGAAIAAVAPDDGDHGDRRGQFQPGEGRPGGPGGFGRDGQFAPPGQNGDSDGSTPPQMPGQSDGQPAPDGGTSGSESGSNESSLDLGGSGVTQS